MLSGRRYDKIVNVQRKNTSINAYGEEVEIWADLITLPAKFEPKNTNSGNEDFFDTLQEQVRRRVRFHVRKPFAHVITELDRIVFEGIVYDIQKVEDVGFVAPNKLMLFCESTQTPELEPYRPFNNFGTVLTINGKVLTINEKVLILTT
jgi:head-tail adaptor